MSYLDILHRSYDQALRQMADDQQQKQQSQKYLKQGTNLAQKAINGYLATPTNYFPSAIPAAQGAESLASTASTASSTLPWAAPTSSVASAVGPTVANAANLTAAGTEAAGAAEAGSAAADTASTTSSAAAGGISNTSIVGAAIGAGLAISSAQPGSWLFPVKRFMYKGNDTLQGTPLGYATGMSLGPRPMYEMAKKGWDNVFGDPEEQLKQRSRLTALQGLNSAFASGKQARNESAARLSNEQSTGD